MKVQLVSHSFEDQTRTIYNPDEAYSLGLAYISSFIKATGHEVTISCYNNFPFSEAHELILEEMREFKPDVLGIQMFTMNRVSSFRLIERCSSEYPDLKIVVGGIHATIMSEQLITRFPDVIIVAGEGEVTFSEVLEALGNNNSLRNIKGLVYSENGQIVETGQRELVDDLDMLPPPDHDMFFLSEPRRTMAHILTSRGCPFMCSFCCLHNISRRRYRMRSVDNIIEEIVSLKTRYPRLKSIQVHDDSFNLDNKRVIALCKKLIELDLGIELSVSSRVKPLSMEALEYMEKAGIKKIMFGLESGAQKIMAANHKGISKKDVLDLFHKIKHFNFVITTFLIVGFPGDTMDTVDETISFVKQLQKIKYTFITGIGKMWVYPGTEIYLIMKEAGQVSDDYWLTDGELPYFTVENDYNTLVKFENKMLYHLSINRIFTPKGFVNHFLSMPVIITKYLLTHKYLVIGILVNSFSVMFPRISKLLFGLYYNIKKNHK